MKKTIIITVMSNIKNDPRVTKYYNLYTQKGYRTIVIGFSYQKKYSKKKENEDFYLIYLDKYLYLIIRLFSLIRMIFTVINRITVSFPNYVRKVFKNLELFFLNMSLFTRIIFFNRKVYKLLNKLSQLYKFNIVHTNDLSCLIGPAKFCKKNDKILIYDAHELWTEMSEDFTPLFKKIMKKIEKKYIQFSSYNITVSKPIGEILNQEYNINKFNIIYNAPMYKEYTLSDKREKKKKFCKKHNIVYNKKILLFLGRYEKFRGLEELINAMEFVSKDIILCLRGYGSIEDELQKIAKSNNTLDKTVFFLQPVNMEDMIQSSLFADAGIMPYKPVNKNNKYAAPNKLFEYMMAGLAIIAIDSPVTREIIIKNNLGLLFSQVISEHIAYSINKLFSETDLLGFQKNAFLNSKQKYNFEKQTINLINFIHKNI